MPRQPNHALLALSGAVFWVTANPAFADYTLNLRQGVTPVSQGIFSLHMTILAIVTIIGIGVFGVMVYSMIKHRKSKGAAPAQFHENHRLEIVWTIIPFLVLVGLAIPATRTLLALEDTGESDLTVKVTGYQWKWQYEYLNDGLNGSEALNLEDPGKNIKFFSVLATPRDQIENQAPKGEHYLLEVDKPLVVPVNKKIRFLMTANDVLHSWWVPDLGFKKDAIPGFINESWARLERPGVYRGQCAELCGKDHGFMPIVVVAKEEEEYRQWIAQQRQAMAAEAQAAGKEWSKKDLMARGKDVYNTNCASCHQANGQGVPNVFPPMVGSKIATGPLADHLDMVIHGSKVNPAMQAFGPQLSDADLAAVITYERNAWGNDTGDVVQPSQIKAAR